MQSPSNGEPWHFLLAPLCIIVVAVPLEFHWRWSRARAEWMGVYGAKRPQLYSTFFRSSGKLDL